MCLTVPGKIIGIEGDRVTVDYGSEKREAKIIEGDYNLGDFVLVKAMIVIEKVSEEQMNGWKDILQGVENGAGG